MSKRSIYIFLILFLRITSLYSTITPQEIKGTSTILQEGYKHLSILPGMVWAKSGTLENIAELYIDDKNPNVELINELFFRFNTEFIPTRSMINDAYYFTPFAMGQIAAHLEEFRQTLIDKKLIISLSQLLNRNFNKFIQQQDVKTAVKNLSDTIKHYTGKETAKGYPLLFLKALITSNEKVSVFKTIGAFVYKKSADKFALHDYYVGIFKTAKNANKVFTDSGFLDKNKWVQEIFHDDEAGANEDSIAGYEQLVFSVMQPKNNWVEPYLTSFTTAYISFGDQRFGFPDCGENSLLNIYRVFFAKKDTKEIDIDLLEKIKTPTKILNFFRRQIIKNEKILNFSKLDDLRSDEARNEWAELFANLENLYGDDAYVDRNSYNRISRPKDLHCEINSGFVNLNRFIYELQGANFDQLVALVNQHTGDNFTIEKTINNNGLGHILIQTKDRGTYKWNFDAGHFYLELESEESLRNIQKWINRSDPEIDLFAFLNVTSEKIKSITMHKDFHYLLTLNKLDSDDRIDTFMRNTSATTDFKFANLVRRVQAENTHCRLLYSIMQKNDVDIIAYLDVLHTINRLNILDLFPAYETYIDILFKRKVIGKTLITALIKVMKPKDIDHAIYLAVNNNLVDTLSVLLSHAGNEALTKHYGEFDRNLLEIALCKNNYEMIDLLMGQIKNKDIIAKALALSLDLGKHQIAEQLLAKISDEVLSIKLNNKNLLTFVIDKLTWDQSYRNILELLLTRVSDQNLIGEALFNALDCGTDLNIVNRLLLKLSDEALNGTYGPRGETLLQAAMMNPEVFDVLVQKVEQTVLGKTLFETISRSYISSHMVERILAKISPPVLSAEYGSRRLNVLEEAIYKENEVWFDLFFNQIKDETVFYKALIAAIKMDNEKLIELLLTKISDETLTYEFGSYKKYSLEEALELSNNSIVDIVLKRINDQNLISKLLKNAIQDQNTRTIKFLLPKVSDNTKLNLLVLAIDESDKYAVKLLLPIINREDLIKKDGEGKTILDRATDQQIFKLINKWINE